MTRTNARAFFFGLLLAWLIVVSLGLLAPSLIARAQTYGSDITKSSVTYIESSHNSTNTKDLAFDDDPATIWQSSGAPPGEWVGVSFVVGCAPVCVWTPRAIRQISIQQGNNSVQEVTSFLVESAQHNVSDTCAGWVFQAELTITIDFGVHYYQLNPVNPEAYDCWRVMGNTTVSGGTRQQISEIQMMVANPTATPSPSSTPSPTITLTPSTTPSPTPDLFSVVVTSTQGSSMRFERSADAGELFIFIALLLVGGLGFIAFSIWFWQRRPDGT